MAVSEEKLQPTNNELYLNQPAGLHTRCAQYMQACQPHFTHDRSSEYLQKLL